MTNLAASGDVHVRIHALLVKNAFLYSFLLFIMYTDILFGFLMHFVRVNTAGCSVLAQKMPSEEPIPTLQPGKADDDRHPLRWIKQMNSAGE